MKENKLKKTISEGKVAFGVISPTVDPVICEYIGLSGFDYYMIDGEHGGITASDVTNLVRACEVTGCTPLARVRSVDPKLILQFLDAGVMGVMMPTVDTVEDVITLVESMKYPPLGKRGLGPVRSSDYMQGSMNQLEYVTFANEQTLVMPQVETLACVENLKEMCSIPEVDGFIIGPRDLAMSMGFYDGPKHKEVQDMLDHIFKVILDNGKFFGTVAGTTEQAEALIQKGASMILNSVQGLIKMRSNEFLKARP